MFQTRCWTTGAATLMSIALPGLSVAATLNVPGDFAAIQACIDAAVSGVDECVVAPGTYHETISFLGKAISLRSSGGADVTTIDATGIGGSVVTCINGEGPDTVLNGFTITNGSGTVSGQYRYGGGLYLYISSPTIAYNTITGNSASYLGGGLYMYNSSPTIAYNTITDNSADAGGGLSLVYSSPTIANNTITGNSASGNYSVGGGLYSYSGSPTVTNCTFSGNTALRGGGVYNSASGVSGSSATVAHCTFSGNTADYRGGGIYNFFGRPKVINCTFNGNKAFTGGGVYNFSSGARVSNCAFRGNTGSFYGGGIVNDGTYLTGTSVTNSTFTGNKGAGGAMYNFFFSNPQLVGCIFWGNSPSEILNADASAPSVLFSDVQGGLPVGAIDGGGNINLDPMFVRPPDAGPDGTWDGVVDDYGDLRLRSGSPCIDAGDPGFAAQPGETDLEGHARVLCARVDMGAYEFGTGDYDCNQAVNLTDFAGWSSCITGPGNADTAVAHGLSTADTAVALPPGCEAFDFDSDGDVDLLDFSGFQKIVGP